MGIGEQGKSEGSDGEYVRSNVALLQERQLYKKVESLTLLNSIKSDGYQVPGLISVELNIHPDQFELDCVDSGNVSKELRCFRYRIIPKLSENNSRATNAELQRQLYEARIFLNKSTNLVDLICSNFNSIPIFVLYNYDPEGRAVNKIRFSPGSSQNTEMILQTSEQIILYKASLNKNFKKDDTAEDIISKMRKFKKHLIEHEVCRINLPLSNQ